MATKCNGRERRIDDVDGFDLDRGRLGRWSNRALGGVAAVGGLSAAGALFAANGLGDSQHWLEIPSEIGVELLLFAVGLKMNPRSIFRFDVAFGTLLHLMLSACILALALTQDLSIEMKIALALTLGFSSTVVAAKGLEARREPLRGGSHRCRGLRGHELLWQRRVPRAESLRGGTGHRVGGGGCGRRRFC